MKGYGDLYHDSTIVLGMASNVPFAEITGNTTTVGATVDMNGYEEFMVIPFSGTLTDGDFEYKLYGSNDSGMSGETEVTTVNGTIPDWEDHSTEADTASPFSLRVAYRYYRIKIVSTNISSGGFLGAIFLRALPKHLPASS